MSIFSLTPYSFQIRLSGRINGHFELDNILDNGQDICELLNDYLSNHLGHYDTIKDGSISKSFKNVELKSNDRLISGLFKAGDGGHGFDVTDVEKDVTEYQAVVSKSHTIPLYYLLYTPRGDKNGVIILQKFKGYNVKDLLFKSFSRYLKDNINRDLQIEIKPFTNRKLIREYLYSERILKIKLLKRGCHRDIAEALGTPKDIPFEGNCEYTICSPKGKVFGIDIIPGFYTRLENFLNSGNQTVTSLIKLDIFEYDSIKIEAKPLGKTSKIIDLSDIDKVQFSEDISDIDVHPLSGHPEFEVIDNRAKVFLGEITGNRYVWHWFSLIEGRKSYWAKVREIKKPI